MWDFIIGALWFCAKGLLLASAAVCLALYLGACSTTRDGDGFSNAGRLSRPVKCVEVRHRFVECRSVE